MTTCPYCQSAIDEAALVCKVCRRDIYLFKPLLARIAELEKKLAGTGAADDPQRRIQELEHQLARARERLEQPPTGMMALLVQLLVYLVLPLLLLMAAHWLITIALDTRLVYLRVVSMVLPLLFGLALFVRARHVVAPWFAASAVLAVASVIGMSWITSLVDRTPVLPQNAFEWREYLEYAASISLSFLTGMLLGHLWRSRRERLVGASASLVQRTLQHLVGGQLSPKQLSELVKKLEEYGGSLMAVGTTAMSIYTGLKGVL